MSESKVYWVSSWQGDHRAPPHPKAKVRFNSSVQWEIDLTAEELVELTKTHDIMLTNQLKGGPDATPFLRLDVKGGAFAPRR